MNISMHKLNSPVCDKCDCIEGCSANPVLCPNLAKAIAQPEQTAINYTYASTQKTKCAGCGLFKHTPLRVDKMGGYVCLTCIDKELEFLLDAFIEAEPIAWRKANSDGFYRYYEADEDQPAGCEPLYENPIAQPKQPAPVRQPLTNEELRDLARSLGEFACDAVRLHWHSSVAFARAIEAKITGKAE